MRVRIPGLKKYQDRNPNGYFKDLNWSVRQRAYEWLYYFCERARRRGYVPGWLFAIYVGQAKRLAQNPPTYEWSRWMNAKKGGYAVQRLYRREGRVGRDHPAHKAADVSVSMRKWRKQEREEAERRKRLSLPPKPRVHHLPLW